MLPFDAYSVSVELMHICSPQAGNSPPPISVLEALFYTPSKCKRAHAQTINHVYFPTHLKLFDTLLLIKKKRELYMIKVQYV